MKCAAWALLALWAGVIVWQRWQAAGAEVDRVRANRNPMVRRDDMRNW